MDKNELFKKFLSLSDHDKCMLFATLWGRLDRKSVV